MTRTEVIAAIARRLGRRTDLDDDILLELDLAQATVLERNAVLPWFLPFRLSEAPALVTTTDQRYMNLPVDLLGVPEHGGLYVQSVENDSDWMKLIKGTYDENLLKYQDAPGFPEVYSLHMGFEGIVPFRAAYLQPIPDAEYDCRMAYIAADTLPSAITIDTNAWMTYAPDLLIYVTAQICARDLLQDFELAASFEGMITVARHRLMVETERHEHEDREYHMGSAP